jgi:hypothetical protein
MDMKIEMSEQMETAPCDGVAVPSVTTELTEKEGSLQERAMLAVVESFLEKVSVDKNLNDSTIEKAGMVTEMLGATDLVSTMLASQMLAVHDALTARARPAMNPDNQQAVSAMVKLSNVFIQQIGMMERLRGHSQQKVVVEHVHVHNGGQAIVGSVTGGGVGHGAEIAK